MLIRKILIITHTGLKRFTANLARMITMAYELYGTTKSKIQQAAQKALQTRSKLELALEDSAKSLERARQKNLVAYKNTIEALLNAQQLEKDIDALLAVSLDCEALFSKYYDEVLYLEGISDDK